MPKFYHTHPIKTPFSAIIVPKMTEARKLDPQTQTQNQKLIPIIIPVLKDTLETEEDNLRNAEQIVGFLNTYYLLKSNNELRNQQAADDFIKENQLIPGEITLDSVQKKIQALDQDIETLRTQGVAYEKPEDRPQPEPTPQKPNLDIRELVKRSEIYHRNLNIILNQLLPQAVAAQIVTKGTSPAQVERITSLIIQDLNQNGYVTEIVAAALTTSNLDLTTAFQNSLFELTTKNEAFETLIAQASQNYIQTEAPDTTLGEAKNIVINRITDQTLNQTPPASPDPKAQQLISSSGSDLNALAANLQSLERISPEQARLRAQRILDRNQQIQAAQQYLAGETPNLSSLKKQFGTVQTITQQLKEQFSDQDPNHIIKAIDSGIIANLTNQELADFITHEITKGNLSPELQTSISAYSDITREAIKRITGTSLAQPIPHGGKSKISLALQNLEATLAFEKEIGQTGTEQGINTINSINRIPSGTAQALLLARTRAYNQPKKTRLQVAQESLPTSIFSSHSLNHYLLVATAADNISKLQPDYSWSTTEIEVSQQSLISSPAGLAGGLLKRSLQAGANKIGGKIALGIASKLGLAATGVGAPIAAALAAVEVAEKIPIIGKLAKPINDKIKKGISTLGKLAVGAAAGAAALGVLALSALAKLGTIAGAAGGALIGGTIGTVVFPGIGTAVGAGLGGLAGGIIGNNVAPGAGARALGSASNTLANTTLTVPEFSGSAAPPLIAVGTISAGSLFVAVTAASTLFTPPPTVIGDSLYLELTKTASPTTLENDSSNSTTITYSITLEPKSASVTINSVVSTQDTYTFISESSLPSIPSPTISLEPAGDGTFTGSYTIDIDPANYQDTAIVNILSVVANITTNEGALEEPISATSTVSIGDPPQEAAAPGRIDAIGSCPVQNPQITLPSYSYDPITKTDTGHGNSSYGYRDFPIPIQSMYAPGCYSATKQPYNDSCIFYGFAIDVDSSSTGVNLPKICPAGCGTCEDLTWTVSTRFYNCGGHSQPSEAGCPSSQRWGYGTVLKASGNCHSYDLYLNHLTSLSSKSSFTSGDGIGFLGGGVTSHLHVEVNIDGIPQKPEDIMCRGQL